MALNRIVLYENISSKLQDQKQWWQYSTIMTHVSMETDVNYGSVPTPSPPLPPTHLPSLSQFTAQCPNQDHRTEGSQPQITPSNHKSTHTCWLYKDGAGMAQLVACPTEKPGTIPTWVRVPGVTRDFSPRVNFQCRLSYSVWAALVCYHVSASVRTLKIPNTGSRTTVRTHENDTYW